MFFHQVPIKRTIPIETYRPFERPGCELAHLMEQGRAVANALGPGKVWMLSSTESGGGVAEGLPRLCSLLADVGVDARWLVLKPRDPRFFQATKALHNLLHGEPTPVPFEEMASVYEAMSRRGVAELRTHVNRSDVLVVHDPQPLAVGSLLRSEGQAHLLWRCHVGVTRMNDHARSAWKFLEPYLGPYRRLLFSNELYIPDGLVDRSGVLMPSIDPLSHKNRELTPYKMVGILRSGGLVDGPEPPSWARFAARAQRLEGGNWVEAPIQDLLYAPTVLQVSRFDRLKGFDRLLRGFVRLLQEYPRWVAGMKLNTERALDELARVRLILAGPAAEGVHDDPEAESTLAELVELVGALDPAVGRRVQLLRLPMRNVRENALMVNALQRMATVIAQCSLKEGFGLTVTEAMWKGIPLVASGVGGIAQQVRPGSDGLLVSDLNDEVEIARALLSSLVQPFQAESRARSAEARVRSHFLVTNELAGWLRELLGLLTSSSGAHV